MIRLNYLICYCRTWNNALTVINLKKPIRIVTTGKAIFSLKHRDSWNMKP